MQKKVPKIIESDQDVHGKMETALEEMLRKNDAVQLEVYLRHLGEHTEIIECYFRKRENTEKTAPPIKDDLISEIFDVGEELKVISNILSDGRPPDSISAQWAIRANARTAIDRLVVQVARIKEDVETIDF